MDDVKFEEVFDVDLETTASIYMVATSDMVDGLLSCLWAYQLVQLLGFGV